MSKHTPGPWVRDGYGTIKTPSGKTLRVTGVAMPCGGRPGDFAEVDANSDLLTAAPELLEALKRAEEFLERSTEYRVGHPGFEQANAQARAAIAKAEGTGK
jgi:hypothetical protein